jgi:signal transduction histidine kinase/ligand-binding sensor domain-containing protein/ABC-type amino acid transport substrate-binding protein
VSLAVASIVGAQVPPQSPAADPRPAAAERPLVFLGDAGYRPLEFLRDGKPAGLHVEIVDALTATIGRQTDVRLLPWGQPEARFAAGEGDAILSLVVTPERRERYEFSRATGNVDVALFVRRSEVPAGWDGFLERRVALSRSSVLLQGLLRERGFAQIIECESYSAGFEALARREVDAVVATRWAGALRVFESGLFDIEPLPEPVLVLPTAIAVRKGDTKLLETIERGLGNLIASGRLQRLRTEWEDVRAVSVQPRVAWVRRQWNQDDGVPLNAVDSLALDADGRLWLGTASGLGRFDGLRFANLSIGDRRLPGCEVTALHADRRGQIWVATRHEGVFRHEAESFVPIAGSADLGPVRAIATDDSGTAWLLARQIARTGAAGVERIAAADWSLGEPFDLWLDGSTLWFAAAGGLYRWMDATLTPFALPTTDPLRCVARLRDGGVFAAGIGLHRFDGVEWHAATTAPLAPRDRIRSLFSDRDSVLWALTEVGVFRSASLRNGEVTWNRSMLVPGRFNRMLQDRDGALWLASERDALVCMRPAASAYLQTGGPISALASDAGTGFWCCSEKGVQHLRIDGWRTIPGTERVGREEPPTFAVQRQGTAWLASAGKLGFVRGDVFAWLGADAALPGPVHHVACDAEDSVWLAAGTRIGRLRDDRFVDVAPCPEPPLTMLVASDHSLWIGTAHAVLQWTGTAWSEPQAVGAPVRHLLATDLGVVAATHGNGLWLFGPATARNCRSEAGLASDLLHGIAIDRSKQLWCNSNEGPFRLALRDLAAFAAGRDGVACDTFPGLPGVGSATAVVGADGRVWFANSEGMAVVDPRVEVRRPPLEVRIERCTVAGESMPLDRSIEIASGERNIELAWSAVDLAEPERLRFRHRLRGYHGEWLDPVDSRTASFAKLPPGDYLFEVQVRRRGESWGGATGSARLRVLPAWYQTTWALVLGVAGGLVAAFGLYRWRTASMRREGTRLERAIALRTEELRAANRELEAFTYTVSHDLRSPLRHINHYATSLEQMLARGETATVSDRVAGIKRASTRMARLVDDLLSLSRLARKEVVRQTVDSKAMVDEVWQDVVRAHPGTTHAFVRSDLPTVVADAQLLRQVWSNLLENAHKYSGKQDAPRVEVRAETRQGRRWFVVVDNGVGFDQAYADKLFVAFHRLHTESEFPGTGIGLAICQTMVQKHGGEITGNGVVGAGATFAFTLDPA